MVTSSLQAEHFVHLRTFLLTLLIVSWQYPSAKLFTDCTSESIELGFSLKIMIFFFVALIDGMVPIFHAFLDASGHLTSMNSVTSVCYKALFDRSGGTLRHVLFCDGCKMALQPNVQNMQFSHFSMRSFEVESSAEEQRTRGQHT